MKRKGKDERDFDGDGKNPCLYFSRQWKKNKKYLFHIFF